MATNVDDEQLTEISQQLENNIVTTMQKLIA
jgi:hypothetical protein